MSKKLIEWSEFLNINRSHLLATLQLY